MTLLLGLDIGTSHSKAGLFRIDGTRIAAASRDTLVHRDAKGHSFYHPALLWSSVLACIKEVVTPFDPAEIACIGVASFAEAGLIIDPLSGDPMSDFIPWFDQRSTRQGDFLARQDDPFARFLKTGQRANFKHGLAKLLWLREHDANWPSHGIWLSGADYIAYRLTGVIATDPTLASRTYAYRMDTHDWDREWIRDLGFDEQLFPPVLPTGTPIGVTRAQDVHATSMPPGIPVCIAGHDHICAAFAVGALEPGDAFDSMGTAETLIGTLAARDLTMQDYESGLAFGCHVVAGRHVWIGGLPASGGSIEWLRQQLSHPPLPYESIQALSGEAGREPTGIYYFPYLSGAGAPAPDSTLTAAFIGLTMNHQQSHLVKAVLEGCAYEMYAIQEAAQAAFGHRLRRVVVAGGGTKFLDFLSIKADVSGNTLHLCNQPEATLLGAAVLAGLGCGVYRDVADAMHSIAAASIQTQIDPDTHLHGLYQDLYQYGYRQWSRTLRSARYE